MDLKLSVPFAEDLTKETGWIQLDRYLYFIARFHLHIEQNQTRELGFGKVLRTFRPTSFSETEVAKTFEEELTAVDPRETTRSLTLANDLNRNVMAAISDAAKSPFYEVSADLGSWIGQTVRSSLESSIRSREVVSRRVSKTFTVRQTVKPGAQELQFAAAGYRKYTQSVFLHYIDYLFVEYRSTAFGLRKKKRNLPRPIGSKHVNLIPINVPLFTLAFWMPETESLGLFTEAEYRRLPKVAHPERVTFEELKEEIGLPLPARTGHPTLYALSNIAFPLRWVDRKGSGSRQELEKIELDASQDSAWWYVHGPGSRFKAKHETVTPKARPDRDEKILPVYIGKDPFDEPPDQNKPPASTDHPSSEEVAFTAFHPKEGKVDTWHTLLVYLHLLSVMEKVRQDARRFKDQLPTIKETSSSAAFQIARGSEITIVPLCKGVEFNPPRLTVKWMEDFQRTEFRFRADPSLLDDAGKGYVTFFMGPLIIGTLKFAMLFSNRVEEPALDQEDSAALLHRDKIFISYSHKDTEIVLAFKKIHQATGYDVLIDIEDLRSGEKWNAKLMSLIDRADIFQLFWSENSKNSKYCEQEWKYALRRAREGFIRPIYWQTPLPEPPTELSELDFHYYELSTHHEVK